MRVFWAVSAPPRSGAWIAQHTTIVRSHRYVVTDIGRAVTATVSPAEDRARIVRRSSHCSVAAALEWCRDDMKDRQPRRPDVYSTELSEGAIREIFDRRFGAGWYDRAIAEARGCS